MANSSGHIRCTRYVLYMWISAFLMALSSVAAMAQAPRTLSVSGVLAGASGAPKPNGSYTLTFRLFDVATGGTPLWTEANKPVTVAGGKGMFSTTLGAPTAFGSLAFDRPFWLEVQAQGEAAPMTPRLALSSAPYSLSPSGTTNLSLPFSGSASVAASGAVLKLTNTGNGLGIVSEAPAHVGVQGLSDTWVGVWGQSNKSTGVHGQSDIWNGVAGISNVGAGVWGHSNASVGVFGKSEKWEGVHGESATDKGVYGGSVNWVGVWGHSDTSTAVFGEGNTGWGVHGKSNTNTGVRGESQGDHGVVGIASTVGKSGVFGEGYYAIHGRISPPDVGSQAVAIYGETTSGNGYAGHFVGDARVTRHFFAMNGVFTSLSVSGAKNFRIDHPLDPESKTLTHSCAEGPEALNIYNGNVTTDADGMALVILPDYFEALNRDFRYQLTCIGQFAQAIVAEEIRDNRFTIRTDRPHVKVSWQVTGVRNDVYMRSHPQPVEEMKPENERGKYLDPESHGQPKEKGIGYLARADRPQPAR